jgi:hypothetical protein
MKYYQPFQIPASPVDRDISKCGQRREEGYEKLRNETERRKDNDSDIIKTLSKEGHSE